MRKFWGIIISCFCFLMLTSCGNNNYESAFENLIRDLNAQDDNQRIYYEYGYVDEDDVPELFVIRGYSHPDPVEVYKFISNENKVMCVGQFGEFGQCEYIPKKNVILASYGGSGYFLNTYSRIKKDGSVELEDCILSDGSSIDIIYYYGFPVGEFSGSVSGNGSFYLNKAMVRPSDEYIISEADAKAIYGKYHEDKRQVSIE